MELALIFLVVILLFGPDKLPEFAKYFAKTVRTIRSTVNEAKSSIQKELEEADISQDIREIGKEIDPYPMPEDSDDPSSK